MTDDVRKKIFTPFHSKIDEKNLRGVGLGMSICHQLVNIVGPK